MSTLQVITNTFNTRSNLFGALASGLCLVHCLATPLLFITQANMAHHDDHHHGHGASWWGGLDFIFLIVAIFAVYYSAKNSSLKWMPLALYISWGVLAFIIVNEKLHLLHLPHEIIYLPALALIGLHLYNKKYCNCEGEGTVLANS